MKLPMVEALRTAETGKRFAINRHLSLICEVGSITAPFSRGDAYEVKSEATFRIVQVANDSRALGHLHDRAARALTHEVYGPVMDRLMEIRTMLWEDGPRYDDKIAEAIDELINDLKP